MIQKWYENYHNFILRYPLLQQLINPIQIYLTTFYRSLLPAANSPKYFWSFCYDDFKCMSLMLFVTLSVWFGTAYTGGRKDVLMYWDGPNYLYAGITLYDISRENPWTKYFRYQPSYFACHLPGFPLLIRLCSFLTNGDWIMADYLAIITSGLLFSYAFRRLLIIYDCVLDPTYTTLLLSVFPLRLVIYHSVGASEPLFLTFVCLSFIFYKLDQFSAMLISIWLGCITRIEGMAIGATIGACFLLRLDFLRAISMFLTFVPTIGLLIMHKAMFDDALAYIKFNSGYQGLVGYPPLLEIANGRTASSDILYLHSFIDFYFLYFIGALIVVQVASPVGIFSMVFLFYVSLLRHIDLFRYSLPAGVFSLLIGFDKMWSNKICKSSIYYFSPFYLYFLVTYSAGQIHSNRCFDGFFKDVLDTAVDKLH